MGVVALRAPLAKTFRNHHCTQLPKAKPAVHVLHFCAAKRHFPCPMFGAGKDCISVTRLSFGMTSEIRLVISHPKKCQPFLNDQKMGCLLSVCAAQVSTFSNSSKIVLIKSQ